MASDSQFLYQFTASTIEDLVRELNFFARMNADQIDRIQGIRGEPSFFNNLNVNGNRVQNVAEPVDDNDVEIKGRSLRRFAPGQPFDAQNLAINNLAAGIERHQAVNKGQLEDSASGGVQISTTTPTQVDAGDVGTGGTPSAASAVGHEHPVNTALVGDIAPVALVAAAGGSPKIPRADHAHAGFDVLSLSGADANVTGTTTETTLYSALLLGGALGTTNFIRASLLIKLNGLANTKTIRLKFGATTVFPFVYAAVDVPYLYVSWLIVPANATNSQKHLAMIFDSPGGQSMGQAVSAEDTTSNKTIAITAQLANGADQVLGHFAVMEFGQ